MTYFIDSGIVMHTKPEAIFQPTYRVAKPHSLQIGEMEELSTMPKDYYEFEFLKNESGISIYTRNTSILPLLLHGTTGGGTPIKYNTDIREKVLTILNGFEDGFRKLWSDWERQNKDVSYKQQGLKEMFKIIAHKIEEEVCD